MQNRRENVRWKISWRAQVKIDDAVTFIDCVIADINFKGLKVVLAPLLPAAVFVKLDIILDKECSLEGVEVWRAWHRKIGGHNLYGFYFSKIKDKDKEVIYKFIRSHFPDLLDSLWWDKEDEARQGKEAPDRRIFERFKAGLPLKYLDLSENKEGSAVTEDISAKGVGFVTAGAVKPGASLEMWVEIADKGEPLYLRGEAAWSSFKDANNCRVGINLEKANLMALSRVLRVGNAKNA
ncbi:MAG: PilZ domain-containing protein [Candidatus Omnitrophota bacterium]